jgi:hypothetical protein
MKANEDKLVEKLVDHIMKDAVLTSTSSDFTSKVMLQIAATQTSKTTVYKPLISKSVLILILAGVVALFIYVILDKTPQKSWADDLDFNLIFENSLNPLLKFSKITLYCAVFTTIMLFMQISFLKKHFDKNFES